MTIIRYYIEYNDIITYDKRSETGFAFGETVGIAIDRLMKYYGADNVLKVTFYESIDSDTGVLTNEVINDSKI